MGRTIRQYRIFTPPSSSSSSPSVGFGCLCVSSCAASGSLALPASACAASGSLTLPASSCAASGSLTLPASSSSVSLKIPPSMGSPLCGLWASSAALSASPSSFHFFLSSSFLIARSSFLGRPLGLFSGSTSPSPSSRSGASSGTSTSSSSGAGWPPGRGSIHV